MAELAETTITLQQGRTYNRVLTLQDADGVAIDITNATASGYIADSRASDATLLATFTASVSDPASGQSSYGLDGASVEALSSSVTYADDAILTASLGYYYMDLDRSTGAVAVTGVDQANKTFTFGSDITVIAKAGAILTVSGSTGNDGSYTIRYSSEAAGSTTVYVSEAIPDATADGNGVAVFALRVAHGEVTYERRTVNA